MTDLMIIAALLAAYSVISAGLERALITAPMVFVAAGIVLGPKGFHAVGLELTHGTGLVVAELALAIVLFAAAARIDLGELRAGAGLPTRLLGIGMPLTLGLGIVIGAVLLSDLDIWVAAIAVALLAPTDAALGQAVFTNERVPARIREALDVESGLNDGLTVPFLTLFLALAVDDAIGGREWVGQSAELIGYGVLAGLLAGGVGGWLVERAAERGLVKPGFDQLAVLALPVLAWAGAEQIGGNGFIGAFVGGLAAGRATRASGKHVADFTESEGQLLNLFVFFVFGTTALSYLDDLTWQAALFAAAMLTVARMLPVAISLVGTGMRPVTVAFMGWFGPRGLATIILTLFVVEEEPHLPGLDLVAAAASLTVLASVVLHGLSAQPLSNMYARAIERLPASSPEKGAATREG